MYASGNVHLELFWWRMSTKQLSTVSQARAVVPSRTAVHYLAIVSHQQGVRDIAQYMPLRNVLGWLGPEGSDEQCHEHIDSCAVPKAPPTRGTAIEQSSSGTATAAVGLF